MSRHSRIVSLWGLLYRMSEKNYRKFLEEGVKGLDPDPRKFGRCVGTVSFDIVDAEPSDYREFLDTLERDVTRRILEKKKS